MRIYCFTMLVLTTIFLFHFSLPAQEILYYADFGIPESFDPITANQASELHLSQLIADRLIFQNHRGEFQLSLAKDLDISPDGLSYTFILRDDLLWSDGKPITSRDVEFSLDVLMNPKTAGTNFMLTRYVEDVVCITPQMITITLVRPFFRPLALFTFPILPKHRLSNNSLQRGDSFSQNPIGCGPFQYQTRNPQEIKLQPNAQFNQRRKPLLAGITARIYPNRKQAIADLFAGKIQLITNIGPEDLAALEKNSQIQIQAYRNRMIHWIAISHHRTNTYSSLLQEPRFRRALLQSIDRAKILAQVFTPNDAKTKLNHTLLTGPFPTDSWAADPQLTPAAYDVAYAKQLLREIMPRKGYILNNAGYWAKDDKPVQLSLKYSQSDPAIVKACSLIAESIQNCGILVSLEAKTAKNFQEEVQEQQQFDLAYCTSTFDETYDLFPLLDPMATQPSQKNFAAYIDSRLGEMFVELHNSLSPWAVRNLSYRIHRFVADETVHLYLWQLESCLAYHKSLKNFIPHPDWLFQYPESWKIIRE